MLLLLLLSRFSRVWLCATPQMAAHQAPPSLGFSRQEHWSGLPFPSPMHESEKWKWSCSVMSDSSWPHGLQPTRLLRPWDFPGKSTGVGCHCLLQVRDSVRQMWTCELTYVIGHANVHLHLWRFKCRGLAVMHWEDMSSMPQRDLGRRRREKKSATKEYLPYFFSAVIPGRFTAVNL